MLFRSKPAIELSLEFAVTKPDERDKIVSQLNSVSSKIAALVADGKVSPSEVTAALKVDNPYVAALLVPIDASYQRFFNHLDSLGYASAAIKILACVANDVTAATTPGQVEAAAIRAASRPQ